jgi:predicted RNA methylase
LEKIYISIHFKNQIPILQCHAVTDIFAISTQISRLFTYTIHWCEKIASHMMEHASIFCPRLFLPLHRVRKHPQKICRCR